MDVGLLRVMSARKANDPLTDSEVDKEYRGAQAENFVLCQLKSHGVEEVCYWRDGSFEVDFIIEGNNGPVPIEVKSGENVDANSLKKYVEIHDSDENYLVSLKQDVGGRYGRIPLYCSGMIPDYVSGEGFVSSEDHKGHGPWTKIFGIGDWSENEGSYMLEFPRRMHGISKPVAVRVLKMVGDTYVPASSEVKISEKGLVSIRSGEPFDGFISVE